MPRGYDKPVYILPIAALLTDEQPADAQASRRVLYDGLRMALAAGAFPQRAGIAVDETSDAAILREAASKCIAIAMSLNSSRQNNFERKFDGDAPPQLAGFPPVFYKASVHYYASGDR